MTDTGRPSDSGHVPPAKPQTPHEVPSPGFETRDADVARVVVVGLGLMLLCVSALIIVYLLVLRSTEPDAEVARPPHERPAAGSFEAVLPSNQELMRKEQEAVEREMLSSYGWVDRDRQIVRIPIERAIEIVGRQGQLPSFPADEATSAAPAEEDAAAPAEEAASDEVPAEQPAGEPAGEANESDRVEEGSNDGRL